MALSKQKVLLDSDTVSTRINRVHGPPLPTLIDKDEIDHVCCIKEEKAQSIELIHHMLGGPNMDYNFIEPDESFEAFDHLRGNLIKDLQDNKWNILFFEDRKSYSANIIVVVIQKPKKHGNREHIVLKVLIRMTVMLQPRVGFCRYLDLTGKSCFMFFPYLTIFNNFLTLHKG